MRLVLVLILITIFSFSFRIIVFADNYTEIRSTTSPDQVLVIYNEDFEEDADGTSFGQDSKEVAEYYQRQHFDFKTDKKPYLLGIHCLHKKKHLNHGIITEDSTDNKNGIAYHGSGKSPEDLEWVRDSSLVELSLKNPETDWSSVVIKIRSDEAGEEKVVYSHGQINSIVPVQISGLPQTSYWRRKYPPLKENEGRCYRFDASLIFPGNVTVSLQAKDQNGKNLKNLELKYYSKKDFQFSKNGADKIPDDKVLNEDVLIPLKHFLEDPANALKDGTLLKDHILYIVLAYGMPYAANGAFGIEHGATPRKKDHGSLVSLEQRLQTLYYDWGQNYLPPVTIIFMQGGPDSKDGVGNFIVSTAMRYPLTGSRWNASIHPDAYSHLARGSKKPPTFIPIAPFQDRRKRLPVYRRLYAAMRVDGGTVEEAKRLVDYALYATRYLRPEMDCSVRNELHQQSMYPIDNLAERLSKAEKENLFGGKELEYLGFRVVSDYGGQGLPFMVMPPGAVAGGCNPEKPDWKLTGFYPGGMHHQVVSGNGWNRKNGQIHDMLAKGVSVSACGAPAYGGGPHITNATFWDNRIVMKYLLRGKDLGEAMLLSNYYTNWSTSYVGDPLMRLDLKRTELDVTAPVAEDDNISIQFVKQDNQITGMFSTTLKYDPGVPEVAGLRLVCRKDGDAVTFKGHSLLYSRRPWVNITSLVPGQSYSCQGELVDPYENRSEPYQIDFKVPKLTIVDRVKKGINFIFDNVEVGEH